MSSRCRQHHFARARLRMFTALGDHSMYLSDDACTFAYRRSHALDGSRPDVSDGEYARNTGFERSRQLSCVSRGRARQYESLVVGTHAPRISAMPYWALRL